MKEKVIKREKGCYLKLPEEFRGVEEVELFPLKEGHYLLSFPLGAGKPAPQKKAESCEEAVLRKIDSLGYSKRSPSQLHKLLCKEEQKALEKLVKEGKIAYIHNKKFKEGIYVVERKGQEKRPLDEASNELANQLFTNGYIILAGSKEAQGLSERLMKQKGSIMGVRGFDGKYYVVTSTYFQKVWGALSKLGEEVTPEEAAEKSSLSIDGCKAVLKLLAEKGDYVEKKGGLYVRVQ